MRANYLILFKKNVEGFMMIEFYYIQMNNNYTYDYLINIVYIYIYMQGLQ